MSDSNLVRTTIMPEPEPEPQPQKIQQTQTFTDWRQIPKDLRRILKQDVIYNCVRIIEYIRENGVVVGAYGYAKADTIQSDFIVKHQLKMKFDYDPESGVFSDRTPRFLISKKIPITITGVF